VRILTFALLLAGCGGNAAPDDAAIADLATDDAASDLAIAPPLARLTNHGGPVLAAPEPWIVVWPGDEALGTDVLDVYRDLFATSYYWPRTMQQYGIGAGTAKSVLVIPQPAPSTITRAQIPALIDQMAAQTTRNANTALVLIIPLSTQLTGVPAQEQAFHNETPGGLPFAVLQQSKTPLLYQTTFDDLSFFASHELAELVTDPFIATNPAWYDDTMTPQFGEIADLCNPTDNLIKAVGDGGMPTKGDYLLSRLYSNAALAQKVDPCWPGPQSSTMPYFYVAATPRSVSLSSGSAMVQLQVVAFGDVGNVSWSIEGAPTGLTIDQTMGTNVAGDVVNVTLSMASVPRSYPMFIVASSDKTMQSSVYDFLVGP
jgi:hypothetical protein